MEKLDLRKMRPDVTAAGAPAFIDVPAMNFIAVSGKGAPEDDGFHRAMETLYSLSYTVKFALKKRGEGPGYTVLPLEGLWWSSGEEFGTGSRDDWRWTVMICQPPHVTADHVQEAAEAQRRKGRPPLDAEFLALEEGRCVQALHIGPYSEEERTVAAMRSFMQASGVRQSGKHHEIYLGDPRRADPSRLKTVLRWPVARV
jgi:hypothetical protein